MSYDDLDTSISNSQPVALYQFDRSATVIWRYTSADRSVHYDGHEWLPLAISDDGRRMTGEVSADKLKITVPADTPVAQLFRGTPPSDEIFLTVRDFDAGADEAEVAWVGSVSSVSWPRLDTAELSCDSLSASMRREGLRLRYERACPHSVYDYECGVQRTDHGLAVTITALDGAGIRIAPVAPGALPDITIYSYGAVEWPVDGTTELRGLDSAAGDRLVLLGGTAGLAVGDTVTIYPGCDGTRATCDSRFGNLLNHGGFPHMPGESLFGGKRWW